MTEPSGRALLKRLLGPCKRWIQEDLFWIDRHDIVAAPLAWFRAVEPTIPVEFRFGDSADVNRLTIERHRYDAAARADGLRRLADGDRIVVAVHNEEIVCYGWSRPTFHDGSVSMSPERFYIYNLFVVPEYRGCRLSPAFYSFLRERLTPEGFRELVCMIHMSNKRSRQVHAKAGFRSLGTSWTVRWRKKSRCLIFAGLRRRLQTPAEAI